MRTLLAGELTQAQSFDSDYYIRLEVQNASGTWIDVGAALGKNWIVNASWGESVDSSVMQYTFVLVQQIGTASLSPLMAASALNVDDTAAYAPLLDIGRLVRASTATMAHGVALDTSKYRKFCDGRIDEVDQPDEGTYPLQIVLHCSDSGAWLMDLQVETSGVQYGTTPVGTALETVVQNILNATIPAGEPAVTLYKQSSSTFAVTEWKQGEGSLLSALTQLVLDATGEDLRYRYDSAHASRLTWFNPDRTRVTVDATFTARQYLLRQLNLSIASVRNVGVMPYVGGSATATNTLSAAPGKYRRRFFRLAASSMITTLAEAQAVINAVVNDLSAPPGEAAAEMPFFWPVQLYDRYTFAANARQFDSSQTFAVFGYQHAIENGRGTTTMTLTARIVGAYGAWQRGIREYYGAGPTLDVVATPSASSYSIAYSASTTPTLTINGVASALPASPITVSRPAAGGVPLVYAFTVLEGVEEVTESVPVQPIDKDTITPDLTVVPGTPTATQIPYTISATNPVTGATLNGITVEYIGTTADGGVTPAGVYPGQTSGTVLHLDRPPFSTTNVASIIVTVPLTGGSPAKIQRTIPMQVRNSFGPSLVVTPTPSSGSYSLAYSGTYDTLTLSIDGTASALPASPIVVTRDANDHVYSFKATKDAQDTPVTVTIPALVVGVPAFSSASIAIFSYASDQVQASWVPTNAPSGATYDLDIWEQTHVTNANIGNSTTFENKTSPFIYTSVNDLDSAGVRTKAFRVFVRMKSGVSVVANAASATTTLPSNT